MLFLNPRSRCVIIRLSKVEENTVWNSVQLGEFYFFFLIEKKFDLKKFFFFDLLI